MSAIDRVRAKFSNAYVGDQQKQQKPSAGSAASSHTHSETHGHPSAGSAGSLHRDSETRGATSASIAPVVTCGACRYFEARPGEQPDGYCRRYATEAWVDAPFHCDGYSPSEAARQLEARRQKVADILRSDPALKYSFDVQGASPAGRPSGPVSVMLGMRDSSGTIITGELAVPPEKWGMAAFIAYWDSQARPS